MDCYAEDKVYQILCLGVKKQYYTLDSLAQKLGVSTRTIRNYIKQINKDLKGIAYFKNIRGKGFYLYIEDYAKFEEIFKKISRQAHIMDTPQKRLAFIIQHLMTEDDSNTIDELAFNMNIGRTTLINDLKKAAAVLNPYGLKIIGKQNKGMYLSGEELNLRLFIIENIYDYLYSDYPLDKEIKEIVLQTAQRYAIESASQEMLSKFVTLMLDRLLNEHPLDQLNEKYYKLLETKEFKIAKKIAYLIERTLNIAIPIPEIIFITLPIVGRRTPANTKSMADITITEEIKGLMNLIIEKLDAEMNLKINNQPLLKDLEYHLTFMINRLIFDIRLKNPLLGDIKRKYPVAYKMAEVAGKVIEEKYDIPVSEDELGYLALYFGVFIGENENKERHLRKVAVVCGTGRGTARIVMIQLQRVIGNHVSIDLFSDHEITKEILSDYDLVFSTVYIPFPLEQPLIQISEIFDEAYVAKEVERVAFYRKYNLPSVKLKHSILSALLGEDRFFILDHNKDYWENICVMVDSLYEKGYVDADFKKRLKEREEKGTTIFDSYIALPHTLNCASENVVLSLGVFPRPLQTFSGKEIKLVFLLGVPQHMKQDSSLLVKIYDEIITVANDRQLINRLALSKSYDEISHLLEHNVRGW
ncbi:BglG family transcription antiterminator [Parageobacillus thermoglucosidasius]|uniref:BglG family transcription antiterminator n=1 Tax=Parageobacillus thermoglucosidasius TaxID=1426 RepID=UPI00025B38E3|nr:BglG family transcription antiterminator [Parageobacillus thermoglucosidasius]KYD14195.1 hypothetical protein B4168_1017 [Anoxybacillus flavithermus]ALF11913.1 transcriptional antiterminator BglG [Parageobacillus thermoglucosidasius]EID45037.1 transcriptional antiterminator, bglG family [Parageobacillus thermoglucosidasius TNO-09.020]OAO87024.1 Sorbitol operon transcription regulator [Parageobacillus thermoglucosidasius]BDG30939.1 transcription antitermination protein BlgG [Parageobacillus 